MKGCVAEQKVSDWQMNAKTLQTVIWRMTSIRLIGFAIRWEVNEIVKKFCGRNWRRENCTVKPTYWERREALRCTY